jgi:hypothetical protein
VSEVFQNLLELRFTRKGNGDGQRVGLIALRAALERRAGWVRLDEERKPGGDGCVESRYLRTVG